MALYRVTLYHQLPDFPSEKPWTNTYHVDLGSKALAADAGEDIAAWEALVMPQYAEIFKIVAQQPSSISSSPVIRHVSIPGLLDIDPVLRLPLFNAVRVTLTDDVDKPTVMYFRFPLHEDQVESGALTGTFLGNVQTNFVGNLLGVAGLRSNSGASFTTGTVAPAVQMRQRDWKRRSRDGFHRGWVPD